MPRNEAETVPFETESQARDHGAATLYFGQQPTIDSADNFPGPGHSEGTEHTTKRRSSSDSGARRHERVSVDGNVTRDSIPVTARRTRWWKFPVVLPNKQWREVWDVVYDILILYSLCTTCFYLAFEKPGTGLYAFDVCVWVYFVLDVILTFNTAYLDDHCRPVTSRRAIAFSYLLSWFFVDIIALLPFSFGGLDEVEYYLRLVRFLRLPDSVNFVDGTGIGALFSIAFRYLPDIQIGNFMVSYYYISLILQQISRMILLSYFLAALYYWYASYTGPEHVYGDMWFVDSARLHGEGSNVKLLHSWYYMMTTLLTIGYGDILPLSFCERILMIVILLVGLTNFSLILSGFVNLITEINEINSAHDLVTQVSNWMESIEHSGDKITPALKSKVIDYFTHYSNLDRLGSLSASWWQASSTDDLTTSNDELFTNLPKNTQVDIITFLFSDIFSRYRKFFGLPGCEFAYEIALHFQPRSYNRLEAIIEENEDVTEVLLFMKGEIACEFCVKNERHQFLFFDHSLIIGDFQIFTSTQSKFTFRSMVQNSQFFAIPMRPFLDLLEMNYPTSQKKSIFQRAAQFNGLLLRTKDSYLQKKNPELLVGRRGSVATASLLFRRIIKTTPEDRYLKSVIST